MNKKSLGYVILKIIGKIAFFLVLVHSGNTDSGCTVNVYRIL